MGPDPAGSDVTLQILPAGRTFPLDVQFLSGDRLLFNRGGFLIGWSLREPSAAAAAIELRDGHDSGGQMLAAISLAASGSDTQYMGPEGIPITSGVFGHVITGAMVGALWIKSGTDLQTGP